MRRRGIGTEALRLARVVVPLALACCGTPPGSGPRESGEVESAAASEGEAEEGTQPLCIPGDQRCSDGGAGIETCEPTGLSWAAQGCENFEACINCVGGEDPLCEGLPVRCAGPCDPSLDAPSSFGCSFVTVWMPWGRTESPLPQHVVVSNPDPTRDARVELLRIPNGSREEVSDDAPVVLAPGASTSFEILPPVFISPNSLLRTGAVWRVDSDLPVSATQNAYPHNTGAAQSWIGASMLLLPEFSFRGDFVIASAREAQDALVAESYFIVVALEDETEVTWAPSAATVGNGLPVVPLAAGEQATLQLHRYDQLIVTASVLNNPPLLADLTGSLVTATKEVAAFGGVPCGKPQQASRTCDALFEQLLPIEYWGRTYVIPPGLDRSTPEHEEQLNYRVLAGESDVTVTEIAGGVTSPLVFGARGEVAEVSLPITQGVVLEGDGAFSVVQYLETSKTNQAPASPAEIAFGNAAMTQIVPVEQYLDRYILELNSAWDTTALEFVRRQGGAPVNLGGQEIQGWTALGEFEWARLEFSNFDVTAVAESDTPFGLTVVTHGAPASHPTNNDGEDTSASHPAALGVVQLTLP